MLGTSFNVQRALSVPWWKGTFIGNLLFLGLSLLKNLHFSGCWQDSAEIFLEARIARG